MTIGKGANLSKRALGYIHSQVKVHKLRPDSLEDWEVFLEASRSQAYNEEYLSVGFLFELCIEAARSELI